MSAATQAALLDAPDSPPWIPGSSRPLPDITATRLPAQARRLDRVGMEKIPTVVQLERHPGRIVEWPAEADAFVRLDRAEAKGIHMSRIFLGLEQVLAENRLSVGTVREALEHFVDSHARLSAASFLVVRLDFLRRAPSLRSDNTGWKQYPVALRGSLEDGALRVVLDVEVAYSSTCPCSAALSRQLASEAAREHFFGRRQVSVDEVAEWVASEAGMPATPHSQRSFADVRVALDPESDGLPIEALIENIEEALGTPVQAAVKREDEQAFARLNGANLMFCEDAARRIADALDRAPAYRGFQIKVRHEESLHAHDAVSMTRGGDLG
ncbi:MAG: GTP cyclohydrolase I FolE2 [Myxococcales bacterium]|nr:GTP cyclohydrolase I FolE2 [Myxococcales bacterium]